MELRHLRYFTAVAEMENVSRAALKLHVSQPALSRQVRDLEEELGFALLERSAKSVRLTEAGRVFLIEARAVLERTEQAINAARAAATGRNEELHIGYAPTVTARVLPPALRRFQTECPKVRVRLHDLSTEEMLAAVRQGSLRLALSVRPAEQALRGLRFHELLRERLCLAVPPGHPLEHRRSVTIREAAREPLVAYRRADYPDYHEMLEKVFRKCRPRPRVAEEHDGVSSLISSVEAGVGLAVVPESTRCVAASRLRFVALTPAPPRIRVGVVLGREKPGPAAESFLQVITAVSENEALAIAKRAETAP
jgi:DNA-binding transcriptional LysR family regulator